MTRISGLPEIDERPDSIVVNPCPSGVVRGPSGSPATERDGLGLRGLVRFGTGRTGRVCDTAWAGRAPAFTDDRASWGGVALLRVLGETNDVVVQAQHFPMKTPQLPSDVTELQIAPEFSYVILQHPGTQRPRTN